MLYTFPMNADLMGYSGGYFFQMYPCTVASGTEVYCEVEYEYYWYRTITFTTIPGPNWFGLFEEDWDCGYDPPPPVEVYIHYQHYNMEDLPMTRRPCWEGVPFPDCVPVNVYDASTHESLGVAEYMNGLEEWGMRGYWIDEDPLYIDPSGHVVIYIYATVSYQNCNYTSDTFTIDLLAGTPPYVFDTRYENWNCEVLETVVPHVYFTYPGDEDPQSHSPLTYGECWTGNTILNGNPVNIRECIAGQPNPNGTLLYTFPMNGNCMCPT